MSRNSVLARTDHFVRPHTVVSFLDIVPGMTVVDFGAGSGAYAHAFAEALESSGAVIAVDIQKELLRRISNEARKSGRDVDIVWSDIEEPYSSKRDDGSVDLALLSNVLFQLRDKKTVLAEARRVLKPRGRLVVIDWSESFGGLGPIDEHVVTKEVARTLCEEAGFRIAEEFSPGAHHYGLIGVVS